MKIKKGDLVKILSGKDKGKEVKVEKIIPKEKKILLMGVNMYKKHVKGQSGQKGGIYDLPRSLNVSKVLLMCPLCKKATKVGYKFVGKEKVRICKKCGREIILQK